MVYRTHFRRRSWVYRGLILEANLMMWNSLFAFMEQSLQVWYYILEVSSFSHKIYAWFIKGSVISWSYRLNSLISWIIFSREFLFFLNFNFQRLIKRMIIHSLVYLLSNSFFAWRGIYCWALQNWWCLLLIFNHTIYELVRDLGLSLHPVYLTSFNSFAIFILTLFLIRSFRSHCLFMIALQNWLISSMPVLTWHSICWSLWLAFSLWIESLLKTFPVNNIRIFQMHISNILVVSEVCIKSRLTWDFTKARVLKWNSLCVIFMSQGVIWHQVFLNWRKTRSHNISLDGRDRLHFLLHPYQLFSCVFSLISLSYHIHVHNLACWYDRKLLLLLRDIINRIHFILNYAFWAILQHTTEAGDRLLNCSKWSVSFLWGELLQNSLLVIGAWNLFTTLYYSFSYIPLAFILTDIFV